MDTDRIAPAVLILATGRFFGYSKKGNTDKRCAGQFHGQKALDAALAANPGARAIEYHNITAWTLKQMAATRAKLAA